MSSILATIPVNPARDAFLRNGLTAALPRMTEVQVRAALEYVDAAYPRVGDAYARMEADYICADAVIAAATTSLRMALDGFAPPRAQNHRSSFRR